MAELLEKVVSNGHGTVGITRSGEEVPLGVPVPGVFEYHSRANRERVVSTLLSVSRGYVYFSEDIPFPINGIFRQFYNLYPLREVIKRKT